MSFDMGLSGLNSSAKALDVIGNNIANTNTVGFKGAQAHFADIYAATLSAATPPQSPGLGANAASIVQTFKQGGISMTNNPLDMAINGQGFFRLSDNESITYSRNGQFRLVGEPVPAGRTLTAAELESQKALLVNNEGLHVTGYVADATGTIVKSSSPQDILIAPAMPASATTTVALNVNLDVRGAQITLPFDPTNSKTYNSSTLSKVYDSQGTAHSLTMYFVAQPNTWDIYTTLDGVQQPGTDALTFDTSGQLTAAMPLSKTFTLADGTSLPITLDLTGSTQFSGQFGVNSLTQDGYPEGKMLGLSVDADGILQARYTNSQTRGVAQLVLAKFANPNGLICMGNNQWIESLQSGVAQLDTPANSDPKTTKGLGALQGAAVEQANVDLNEELVALIVQQRSYQANAQSIKTQDQMLQTLAGVR